MTASPPVIGVVGGSGGVGASTFAAVLAIAAGAAVLVDLDVSGPGVDVLLGIEEAPGARWSGLRLAGGHLDPQMLLDGLPCAGPCAVLAADTDELAPDAVVQVLHAARASGPVVLDLPRSSCPERRAVLPLCDLIVVVARSDVAGLVAAHVMVSALGSTPTGLVARRGDIDAHAAADLVGAPLLGVLPSLGSGRLVIDPARLPRGHARVATGVLSGASARAHRLPPARHTFALAVAQ